MTQPRLKVLVAYSMSSTYNATTLEYLSALERYTDFDVSYVHVTHDAEMDFDLNEFDVIFQNYCARLCFEGFVSGSYRQGLSRFTGLKVVAVQDDYDRTSTLHQAVSELGFHVLLTCIQSDFWPIVYPASALPGVHIVQGLTGYVPETLVEMGRRSPPLSERRTIIGYRGRNIGARYGRLGFEKYEIGRRMIEICTARGIAHDIAMDDTSRIYGSDWYEFLGNCRVVLGSESGSNVFDFDGSIERSHSELTQQLGRAPTYEEFRPYIDHVECQFNVGQISPRVFECAVMHTPMVLFRGRYSDAIEPDIHYIALEKDFSNIDAVLRRIDDLAELEAMSQRAYDRLVSSELYGYKAFAAKMKAEIERQYELRIAGKVSEFRPESPLPAKSNGVDLAELPIRSMLRERPTARPRSLKDFLRKHERLTLAYYVQQFPELHAFYSNAVAACVKEINRLAADYETAAELHAQMVAEEDESLVHPFESATLTEFKLLRTRVEEEMAAVTSRVNTVRQQRKAAQLTGDEAALELALDRKLETLKQYFARGPQLYQEFNDIYQRTRDELIEGARVLRDDAPLQRKRARAELEYFVEKFPELQSFYPNAVNACIKDAKELAADYTVAADLRSRLLARTARIPLQSLNQPDLNELMLRGTAVEEELAAVTSRVDTVRQQRMAAQQIGDEGAVESALVRELEILKHYFERGPQLYHEFNDAHQRVRTTLIDGARTLRGTSTQPAATAKAVIRRIPGVQSVLNLRRNIRRLLG